MFRSILVPLDRSAFAEAALPPAVAVARRAGAPLHLVEVHELYGVGDPHAGWAPYEPDRDAEWRRREQLYLDATAKWLSAAGDVRVTAGAPCGSAVLLETVADNVLEQRGESERT
jgi:nucleotide-binding universal stress UspA family protein